MTKKDPDFKSEHKLVVPGLPEVGKAIEGVADETINQSVKGFRKTLGAIFGPASEQFGEAWADRVKQYRYLQHLKFVAKVQTKHQELGIDENYRIKPRLMVDLIENSSLEDDSDMQGWWAGLSISSLEDVPSDDNLIFINMMKQITSTQRKIIEYMCTNAEIKHTPNNLIVSSYFMVSRKDLVKEI